jgi:hypothetical protein
MGPHRCTLCSVWHCSAHPNSNSPSTVCAPHPSRAAGACACHLHSGPDPHSAPFAADAYHKDSHRVYAEDVWHLAVLHRGPADCARWDFGNQGCATCPPLWGNWGWAGAGGHHSTGVGGASTPPAGCPYCAGALLTVLTVILEIGGVPPVCCHGAIGGGLEQVRIIPQALVMRQWKGGGLVGALLPPHACMGSSAGWESEIQQAHAPPAVAGRSCAGGGVLHNGRERVEV